jgi:hypothetical protein
MDDTGAPLTVQKELMRHAIIQTTMNAYGKAMSDTNEFEAEGHHGRGPCRASFGYWELMGVWFGARKPVTN